MANKVNNMEGPGTVNEHMAHNWFRRFKEGNSSPKDKPRLKRLSVGVVEALFEMVEQQPPGTSTLHTHTHTYTYIHTYLPSRV